MTAKIFFDSNVIVYSCDANQPGKQPVARDWLHQSWEAGAVKLSTQVLQEVYSIITRKLQPPMPTLQARGVIEELRVLAPAPMTADLLAEAWKIEDQLPISWWDALIVASARRLNCQYLLSENLQHGRSILGLTVVNPFETDPVEILR